MDKNKKIIKISILLIIVFVIILGTTYAIINLTGAGGKCYAGVQGDFYFYLYTGIPYWTITANSYRGSAWVYAIYDNNYIIGPIVVENDDYAYGVRPVISLAPGTSFLNNGAVGSKENPYVVE